MRIGVTHAVLSDFGKIPEEKQLFAIDVKTGEKYSHSFFNNYTGKELKPVFEFCLNCTYWKRVEVLNCTRVKSFDLFYGFNNKMALAYGFNNKMTLFLI